jgi:hypothetical protein
MRVDRDRSRQIRKQSFKPTGMIIVRVTEHNGIQISRIEIKSSQIVEQNLSTATGVK